MEKKIWQQILHEDSWKERIANYLINGIKRAIDQWSPKLKVYAV